jgi:hypothetical protein
MWPTMKIPTSVGDMLATITGDDHAHLEGLVEVRGIQYNAMIHIYKQPDGSWGIKTTAGLVFIRRGSPSVGFGFSNGDASPSATKKIVDAFTVAWKEAASKNADVLRQAQRLRHEEDCHRLAEKLIEARKVVAALEVQLETEREAIHALDRAVTVRYAFNLRAP